MARLSLAQGSTFAASFNWIFQGVLFRGAQALTGVIQRSSAQTVMGLDAELQSASAALQACNPTAISLKAGCELFLRYATRTSALEDQNFASAKARIIQVRYTCPWALQPPIGVDWQQPLLMTYPQPLLIFASSNAGAGLAQAAAQPAAAPCVHWWQRQQPLMHAAGEAWLTSGVAIPSQRGNHFAETSTRARATIADMGAPFVRSGDTVLCHGHRCAAPPQAACI